MNLYKQEILDHYRYPRHRGRLIAPDVTASQYNPSCGDQIVIEVALGNGYITQIAFEGSGCVISQAAASMLAERVKDTPIVVVLALTSDDMLNLLGMELGPTRLKCALLCLYALQEGLARNTRNA